MAPTAVALLGLVPAAAGASAGSSNASVGTLALTGQTEWVQHADQRFTVNLTVDSALPTARLGLHFSLYSRLGNRVSFDASLANDETSQIVLDAPPTIPLGLLTHRVGAAGIERVTITFPVTTAGATAPARAVRDPTLGLSCATGSCDGVYPLNVQLVDVNSGAPLSAFTTHLVYAASENGTLKLGVAVIVPAGTSPALTASGASAITSTALSSARSFAATLAAYRDVPVTIALYPQLALALGRERSRAGRLVGAAVRKTVGNRSTGGSLELLGEPFAPVDVRALASNGVGSELASQLVRGSQVLASQFRVAPTPSPFVASGQLDSASFRLLRSVGVTTLVLPAADVAENAASTVTAPVEVASRTGGSLEALLADHGLATHYGAHSGDPALAAADVLSELAQIYFDAPNALEARGVVLAPGSWGGRALLGALLEGLRSSPVLRATTLATLFGELHLGANGLPTQAKLLPPAANAASTTSRSDLAGARRSLAILRSVLTPPTHAVTAQLARLSDAVLLSESRGLTGEQRSSYLGGSADAVAALGSDLKLGGSPSVTLTAAKGRIPITILSSYPGPLRLVLRLYSTQVEVSTKPMLLQVSRTLPTSVEVTTRTSGTFPLRVELSSPVGGRVLLNADYTVTSTAVNSVAILLSAGAALVLAAWWLRSVRRHRRAKFARIAAAREGPETAALFGPPTPT